jgi:hypothetical protein
MATGTHERGTMEIDEQASTYSGFINMSISSGLLIAAALFFVTLHFAAGVPGSGSFALGASVGIVGGIVMKRQIGYYFLTMTTLVILLASVWLLAAFTG